MYACAELARRERKQTAPRTNVEKAQPGKAVALEQASKGKLRFGKLMRVERTSKVEPVLAKPEAAVLNFGVRHADPVPRLCDKIAGQATRWQIDGRSSRALTCALDRNAILSSSDRAEQPNNDRTSN